MHELTYDIPGALIALALFVSMAAAVEVGTRLGRRAAAGVQETVREHVRFIQGATLGILAIVLGFTLSLALQRYDSRSEALVAEANALGTAWLRIGLLPPDQAPHMRRLLHAYAQTRVEAGRVSLDDHGGRQALAARTSAARDALWEGVRKAIAVDSRPATGGLFVQAINEAFDNADTREAALDRHVPEPILDFLYACLLFAGGIVGYGAGLAGHRLSLAGYLLAGMMVLLVFLVLDLDRPRRGLVQVSQKPLVDLVAAWPAAPR